MNFRLPLVVPLSAMALLSGSGTGCADRTYVRGSQDPSVDQPAMSTSLDKADIGQTLQTLLNKMRVAPIMNEADQGRPGRPSDRRCGAVRQRDVGTSLKEGRRARGRAGLLPRAECLEPGRA
jgi:hypothetical protein